MFSVKLKISIFLILITLALPGVVTAHQPKIVEQSPVPVTEPEVSKAYYGELAGESVLFEIDAAAPFKLYAGLLVPDRPGVEKNMSALISKDGEFFAFLDGASFKWQPFYEPYGGDKYFQGPEIRQDAPAGRYIIEVFGPEYNGKYVLAVGEQEKFDLKEIAGTYKTLYHLKKDFFGQPGWTVFLNRISLFVFGPVILVIFLLAVIGIIIYKRESKR